MKQALIIFGEDWGRHPSSTQHIAKRLASYYDIIWVNSVGLRKPKVSFSDLKRLFIKAKSMAVKEVVVAPFKVMSLPALPFPNSRIAFYINRFLWKRQLSLIKTPVLWASLPSALPIVGELDERAVIYYCGDDFGGLAGVDHAPVLKLEAALALRADFIFAASEKLAAKFNGAYHLPHGVDYELFATPVRRAEDLPQGRPIAGFYGSISDWIDLELCVKAALALPHWNFVFIGDIRTNVSTLQVLPNVYFLGARDHSVLPSYVQHFDVAMLPFLDNEQIRACNPLKLREYLASGTAIVSTNFPALLPYQEYIHVAEGDAFIEAITNPKGDKISRQTSVVGESWEARANYIHSLLEGVS